MDKILWIGLIFYVLVALGRYEYWKDPVKAMNMNQQLVSQVHGIDLNSVTDFIFNTNW